ncbi:hypothetical protein AB0M79_27355, partial [Polymorphospora sp. NPDC051019]|uniref:hypothetical protein n=1 Tax=Polymorphospora sp. NPDC051019 TaxID=3155725 RepID=UPI00343D5DD2
LPDPIALLVLHTELAVCHGELGDKEAAASAATTLLLANLLEKQGRADEAIDLLRTALARVEQLAAETGTGSTTRCGNGPRGYDTGKE